MKKVMLSQSGATLLFTCLIAFSLHGKLTCGKELGLGWGEERAVELPPPLSRASPFQLTLSVPPCAFLVKGKWNWACHPEGCCNQCLSKDKVAALQLGTELGWPGLPVTEE